VGIGRSLQVVLVYTIIQHSNLFLPVSFTDGLVLQIRANKPANPQSNFKFQCNKIANLAVNYQNYDDGALFMYEDPILKSH